MSKIDLNVRPGVVAAILFIFLDIFAVGVLDIVLARVVCLTYYRNINEGRPISVKSADIPGLSNYLLGDTRSIINVVAILTKLALLGVVLTANISIDRRDAEIVGYPRSGTYLINPSDQYIKPNGTVRYTVQPRLESSKSCLTKDNEELTYYSLRFNLVGNVQLSSDVGEEPLNETGQYAVDDSSVICMSPDNVDNPDELVKVKGCTRVNKTIGQSCLTVVSSTEVKSANISKDEGEIYPGEITHKFVDYDQADVNTTFSEYTSYSAPLLTCLTTEIGIDSITVSSRYTHCLLVAKNKTSDGSIVTIVERWILGPDEQDNPEMSFILEYPGIIFEGDLDFGRIASARYLQLPFPFTDYRTMSGELIAQAHAYKYIGGERSQNYVRALERKDNVVVTTVDVYAVVLVAVSVVTILVAFVVTMLLSRSDKRPWFNTINGLSSIVREEHVPSGRSYVAGESALLGLRFTNDDRLHFGPLKDSNESVCYQDSYDIS